MSNELSNLFSGAPVSLPDDKALYEAVKGSEDFGAREAGNFSYMNFSGRTGRYSIGQEKRDLETDEPFLVAIPLFKTGYISWKGGKPQAERMAGLREPVVPQPDPDDGGPYDRSRGEGWSPARSLVARSLMNGEQVKFTNNSKSGVAEFANLHKQVSSQLGLQEPPWPIVTFGCEQFEANGYKNFKPTITVVKWLSTEEIKEWKDGFDPMSWLEGSEPKEVEGPKRRKPL